MAGFKHLLCTGVCCLEKGVRDFDSWSQLMIDDLGPAVRPYLKYLLQLSLLEVYQKNGPRDEKKNCWEFTNCGRQSDGERVKEYGICPAFMETRLNGIHGGKNGGRACWIVKDTLCNGKIQGRFQEKFRNCKLCSVFQCVRDEEGPRFIISYEVIRTHLY